MEATTTTFIYSTFLSAFRPKYVPLQWSYNFHLGCFHTGLPSQVYVRLYPISCHKKNCNPLPNNAETWRHVFVYIRKLGIQNIFGNFFTETCDGNLVVKQPHSWLQGHPTVTPIGRVRVTAPSAVRCPTFIQVNPRLGVMIHKTDAVQQCSPAKKV